MKNVISLLILIPTAISILLFTVAAFSYKAPKMLIAAENPVLAICCIVGGIIAITPLLTSMMFWIVGAVSNKRKNRDYITTKNKKDKK